MAAGALDHVGLCARDPVPLWAAWERMGFVLSPISPQSGRRGAEGPVEPFGTGNRCAFLRHGYLELLGILDPALFANGVDRFIDRYAGLHILAFGIEDPGAELARLRRGGVSLPGVVPLERPVEPGGPVARFARLPLPDAPEGRLQLIRHLTPDLVWNPRWMGHRNGVVAVEGAILAAEDPAATTARLSRLIGLPARPDPVAGFRITLPGAAGLAGPQAPTMETWLRVLPPVALPKLLPGVAAPGLPFMAGVVIRTEDAGASARAILAGLPTREAPDGIMVPPEQAGGAAVVFA